MNLKVILTSVLSSIIVCLLCGTAISASKPQKVSVESLLHPTTLNTKLALNQMELARKEIETRNDQWPLVLPGATSRLVATRPSFNSQGHLNLGPEAFWGNAKGISTLVKMGVNQIVLLEVTEDLDDSWIENAVNDLYYFARPKIIIVGNELNLKIFKYKNVETYYHQLSVAYQKAKSIDPSVQVYLYGCSPSDVYVYERPDIVLEALLSYYDEKPYSPSQKYPFDGIAYHAYLPNQFEGIATVKAILAKHNLNIPILIGETGLHVSDTQPRQWDSHLTTPEDQANYLWQSVVWSFAQGAEYVVYHTAGDYYADDGVYWGLYRMDGSARPAADAFKFAERVFNNVETSRYEIANDVTVFTLYRTDGMRVRIVWNNSIEPKVYGQIEQDALLFDRYGQPVNPVPLGNGQIGIWLPGRYTEFVAGDVIVIVDSDMVPANNAKLE